MFITTKKGDSGASEYFGKKISKGGKLLEAIGTLDELQAVIQLINYELRIVILDKISNDLYLIMGKKLTKDRIGWLEGEINKLEKEINIENEFVIFKKKKAVELNWLRTVVRRAERRCLVFKDEKIRVYLNRLSDFIYLMALKEEV